MVGSWALGVYRWLVKWGLMPWLGGSGSGRGGTLGVSEPELRRKSASQPTERRSPQFWSGAVGGCLEADVALS